MADPRPELDPDRDPARDEQGDEDESLIDEMRGSGVGLEDPNIVGSDETDIVDAQVQEDQDPEV